MLVVDRKTFLDECEVKCNYHGKSSSYYTVTYEGEEIRFCISDHHGKYRKCDTIISKKRTLKHAKQIAWTMYENGRSNTLYS